MTEQQSSTEFSTLDTALWIVDSWPGARVFPTDGKVPAHREFAKGTSWKDNATTDPDLITAWYTGTNYGIGVTGILTVDSDLEDDGEAARARWGSLLDDAIVWSGHPRRRSFAFAQTSPPTGDGKWFTADGKPGGEVKGSGYVVVPPSPHVSSSCPDCAKGPHPYLWRQTGGMHNPLNVWAGPALAKDANPDGGRVEVPEQWLTSGDPCRTVQRILDGATDWTEGGRHTTMTEAQLRVLRLGEQGHHGAQAAMATVYERFRGAVGNDLTRARQAREEFRRALEGAAGRIVADGFTDVLNYGCCGPVVVDRESAVFDATPILAGVRQAARAGDSSPWSVLGGVLALVSAHTPHTYCLPGRGSLNLFVGFVGPSGAGKSTGWAVAGRHLNIDHGLLSDVNTPHALAVSTPTGEGILAAFLTRNPSDDPDVRKATPYVPRDQPNVIVHVDEIDQLAASSGRAGSTIEPILNSLWSGTETGTQTADAERRRHLAAHSYRVAMAVGIQPDRAGHLLSTTAQGSGTAQRWLWLPALDPAAVEDVDEIMPLTWRCPFIPWSPHGGGVRIVAFPAAVMAEIKAERRARLRGEHVGLDSHATLQRMKVAANLALLHGEIEVSDAMWDIAGHVMDVSDETRAAAVATLARAAVERSRAKGRETATEEDGYTQARIETGARKAAAYAVNPSGHKHPLVQGCSRRCFTQRMRVYREIVSECLDHAVRAGWLTIDDDDRYHPVLSQ